jgi:hypothetical protein
MKHPDIATERTIDPFDAAIGLLTGLTGGVEIKPATVQVVTPIVGRTDTFIVQTIRHEIGKTKPKKGSNEDEQPIWGITQFIQRVSAEGVVRIVLPPKVSKLLASQRESVTDRVRKDAGQRAIQTRKDRGDVLGNPEALKRARKARKAKRKS